MNPLLRKLLAPRHEYLTLDRNFLILETSFGVKRFADCPDELSPGKDIRLFFPEMIGLEETLIDILEGRQISFELKGVARSDTRAIACLPGRSVSDRDRLELALASIQAPAKASGTEAHATVSDLSSPVYFDLYISEYYEQEAFESRLVVLLEDATERMVSQQTLVQQANEASLLLSALAASKTYIDRILTSMADALLVTTASGIIKTVNQAAQDLFGYSQEELVHQSISMLITDKQLIHEISQSVTSEFLSNREVVCQTKTGENISVAFSCSTINTDLEGLPNFVYIGRDITERKRAEAEILKALEREKELRELKSRFISTTSHEFRIPLTAILSSTELIENYSYKWTEEKKDKHFNRIKSSVKRMTELLEDVLLVSKAEAGKLEFNPKQLMLKSFCRELVEEMQLGVGEKHKINFVYSGKNNKAYLDEKLLLHILNNLLTNAIKYSPQDTIVSFYCNLQDEEVIFEIQDEGIGIPIEDQNRLFETFHRATNVGNIPGTGLGLVIVQRSVELHGGKIMVKSEVGVGTTFRVILPLISTKQEG